MFYNKSLLVLVFISMFSTSLLYGERPTANSTSQYLSSGGDVYMSAGGTLYLPTTVIQSASSGDMSNLMNLLVQNNSMKACIEKVVAEAPTKKTSFAAAKAKFTDGICKLNRCFQQMLLFDYVAQGTSDEKGASQQAQAMIAALSKSQCASGSQDVAVDPQLVAASK